MKKIDFKKIRKKIDNFYFDTSLVAFFVIIIICNSITKLESFLKKEEDEEL